MRTPDLRRKFAQYRYNKGEVFVLFLALNLFCQMTRKSNMFEITQFCFLREKKILQFYSWSVLSKPHFLKSGQYKPGFLMQSHSSESLSFITVHTFLKKHTTMMPQPSLSSTQLLEKLRFDDVRTFFFAIPRCHSYLGVLEKILKNTLKKRSLKKYWFGQKSQAKQPIMHPTEVEAQRQNWPTHLILHQFYYF